MTYKEINKWNWHDFCLNEIKIDYENIVVSLLNPSDKVIDLICQGFIGIQYLGQWDENVINDINIVNKGDISEKSLEIIKANNEASYKGGGIRDFNHQWLELQIHLIDGVTIKISCMNIESII